MRGFFPFVSLRVRMTSAVGGDGVEEGEEDAGDLGEVLVAEAGEDEGAGRFLGEAAGCGFGERRDGGAEGPGAGGVVGDVEQEIGREEFEAAGPVSGNDAQFDGLEQVRGSRFEVRGGCCEEFEGGGDGEGDVALLVGAGEGGTDVEGFSIEVEVVVVGGEGGGTHICPRG
jgi:hypothetical protein